MMRRAQLSSALVLIACLLALGPLTVRAGAEGFADDGGAQWRVEQPAPPPPPAGVEGAHAPIGLGKIGDIEFYAPNRGALITSGNGSSIPAGVWLYDGERWRELATECGAGNGRIAWAGPNEFWTISNGRPGQALGPLGEVPPTTDNTLCHFAPGATGKLEIVASYASEAFLSTSYPPMDAAACLSPTDCWFAGESLPEPQVGAFQLHWNGHALLPEPYPEESHPVHELREFDGSLYASVKLSSSEHSPKELRPLPPLHVLSPESGSEAFEPIQDLPLYETGEFRTALEYLHLGADESSLWAAAGPQEETPKGSNPANVTIGRYSSVDCPRGGSECTAEGSPEWSQVVGPESAPSGAQAFPGDTVTAIAAEPGTNSAWLALDTTSDQILSEPAPDMPARVARISANGEITDQTSLPSNEHHGPQGPGEHIACPAAHDCWLATSRGWLLHLSTEAEEKIARDTDGVFASEEPITFRPADEGLPQVAPDTIPEEDAGVEEQRPINTEGAQPHSEEKFASVQLPLLTRLRSRLIDGTTLQLTFHLAVKAQVRLVAMRKRTVVASTRRETLKAGNHALLLRLDRARWPTKLDLQTKALAKLPTASTREAGINSVSTSLVFPNLGPLGKSRLIAGLNP
jgi:hypothetical protein